MSNTRVSKSGVKRHGTRAGNVDRLNQTSRAYSSVVKQSAVQYDGSHGFRLADGSWGTWVSNQRLKDTGPLLHADAEQNTFLQEQSAILPTFKPSED